MPGPAATLYTAYADKREAALAACELHDSGELQEEAELWKRDRGSNKAPAPGLGHPCPPLFNPADEATQAFTQAAARLLAATRVRAHSTSPSAPP